MGLYHPKKIVLITIILFITGCTAPQITQSLIEINLIVDQQQRTVQIPAGSTVQDVIESEGVDLGDLDRTVPPLYTIVSDGSDIKVIRVREEFYIEKKVIPFDNQIVRNESLPIGETRLSQPGFNGLEEVTYRLVFEDDVEISKSIVKTVIIQEPIPEIMMVGSRSPFATIPIGGRLAYLSGGNAWIIEGTSANRRPVVTTGDLDGQIFALSPDGAWLLFTRKSPDNEEINTLWAAEVDNDSKLLIELNASNIIHFAEWNPKLSTVAYSTVEPRDAPPGWQANNDLLVVGVSSTGYVSPAREEIEPNSGGVYGWWGTMFEWSPDGQLLAYSRPDGIGIYDPVKEQLSTIFDIVPYQTGSDWAWVPGLSWSPGQDIIYTVDHVSTQEGVSPEQSQRFNLVAIPLAGGVPIYLASDVGMFSYPSPSPLQQNEVISDTTNVEGNFENFYQIAYLEAIFPNQSETSRYKLNIMDRDGSNRKLLFPRDGSQGIEPQKIIWSPIDDNLRSHLIALLYQNNIWLIDTITEQTFQITGDGTTVKIDWK